MGEVSKVFNEGWFNCFVSFVDNGAPTSLCREVLLCAGITKDEAYEFMECGECSTQVRTELEKHIERLERTAWGDEDED